MRIIEGSLSLKIERRQRGDLIREWRDVELKPVRESQRHPSLKGKLVFAILFLICLATAYGAASNLNPKAVGTDGLQNYQGAYNLATTGVLSFTQKGAGNPSMSREPLPPAILSLWLRVVFPQIETANPAVANGTPDVMWVKGFNVLIVTLIVIAVFVAAKLISGNYAVALLSSLMSSFSVIYWSFGLNSMYTEPVASLFILISMISAFYLIAKRDFIWAGLFGFSFGFLALAKAVGFSIFVPSLILILLLSFLKEKNFKKTLAFAVISTSCFIFVVGPWLLRNNYYFDDPSIAMRGGRVLYYRMLINEMPEETYRASFYAWAPRPVKAVMSDLYGFSASDLEAGGAGQWLNRSKQASFYPQDVKAQKSGKPELASTYISRLRAEYNKRTKGFRKDGAVSPGRSAADSMQRDAVRGIRSNPGAHLAAMLPLAWQGFWMSNVVWWAGPVITLSLFFLFGFSVLSSRWSVAGACVVPLGFYGIYLAATHMLPRYVEPLAPAMIVALVCSVYFLLAPLLRRKIGAQILQSKALS